MSLSRWNGGPESPSYRRYRRYSATRLRLSAIALILSIIVKKRSLRNKSYLPKGGWTITS